MQNLARAADTQGEWDWWVKVNNEDPDALFKIVENYKARQPVVKKGTQEGVFPMSQYIEERRRERLLKDLTVTVFKG